MEKEMDERKRISSEEFEFQYFLDQDKLIRDKASLETGGFVRGFRQGYEEGFKQGYEEGFKLGRFKSLIKVFKNMRVKGYQDEQIRYYLSIDDSSYEQILDYLDTQNTENPPFKGGFCSSTVIFLLTKKISALLHLSVSFFMAHIFPFKNFLIRLRVIFFFPNSKRGTQFQYLRINFII